MLILGIDAGFTHMGVVVVDWPAKRIVYKDTMQTKKSAGKRGLRVADDDAERCQYLVRALLAVLRDWQPAGAVVELPSGGSQSARAHRAMGMSTAIVAAVLEMGGIPTEWVTPMAVKKETTGHVHASKQDVQSAVSTLFTWPDVRTPATVFEHQADAAAAVWAARHGVLVRMLESQTRPPAPMAKAGG